MPMDAIRECLQQKADGLPLGRLTAQGLSTLDLRIPISSIRVAM
jgi:hypothetical protein